MIVDSHQHYWKLDEGHWSWITPATGRMFADYLPADLAPHLREWGIDRTVVVQAAPNVEETHFMLRLADGDPSIAGVVGWLDLERDDFPRQFEAMRRYPKFVGIRPMIQDLPSGMVPEKEGEPWSADAIRPYAEHVLNVFGPKRVMFGSDWPVCLYAATYEDVFRLARSLTGALDEEARNDVFARNAIRFYKLAL